MSKLTGGSGELTDREETAVELLVENGGAMTRDELYAELDLPLKSDVSDLMRSLRYKDEARFSIDDGQFHLKK